MQLPRCRRVGIEAFFFTEFLQFPGAPKEVLDVLESLARASNMESYAEILEAARVVKTSKAYAKTIQLVDYVDQRFRRENLIVPLNVARAVPFVRFGQSTNNACEQFFAVVRNYLELPLPLLVDKIISHTTQWHVKQQRAALQRVASSRAAPSQLRLQFSPAAVTKIEELTKKGDDYDVVYQC